MSIAPKAEHDRNQEATVYLGNLDDRCSDALIWELMLQAGPVSNVFLPKDRISGTHSGYGFCEFLAEQDADYATKIMNQIKLYGKPIRVSRASYDTKKVDIGANLFIGNLEESVDESQLYETFQTFGSVAEHPKIARDPTTGQSKGYGFIGYHEFEAADMAIENMNGQFFGGKQINVQYAFKKDGKERHGTQAERLMAAQAKKHSMGPGSSAPNPMAFQGRFAGALSSGGGAPSGHAAPPPPPGMPMYRPPMPPGPPGGGPPMGQPQYGAPPPGYPPPQGFQNGYQGYGGGGGQAPPPGFGSGPNGYPQHHQPPDGFQHQNQYQQGYPPRQPAGFHQQQGYQQGGAPPPPPPLRMGFEQ